MRARILEFVQTLRDGGVDVSVAETLDAVAAVAAAGVEREVLRESLAAALVKDERDRAAFDALFDAMFPLVGPADGTGRRKRRRAGGGGGREARGSGDGDGGGRRREADRTERSAARPSQRTGEPRADREGGRASRAARTARLLALPFAEFTSRDGDEARGLVRELGRRLRARLTRRDRAARRGRVDFRRTIRGSIATGGVPVRPRWRARRPGRPDLVALCDLSGSVAAASELCLGLIAPAADYFRRVHFFAYVDRLVPVSIEDGHVAPDGRLDLHARSDFGRVLADLWEDRHLLGRSTLLLVVGDARNNRRPPRADLFRAAAERAQRVLWLVPEPEARWNTGDSALAAYAPACDAVVECVDLEALVRVVQRAL